MYLTGLANFDKDLLKCRFIVGKSTLVLAPLTFKEADADYLSDSDFAKAETIISKFIKGSNGDSGRIFEWQTDTKVNLGMLKDVNGIIENHYVSIEVGYSQLTILVVDNLSPFTPNILDCLDKLRATYICKNFRK